MSTVHNKEIFTRRELEATPAMSRTFHDVAYRLELTREAIGVSAAELCQNIGLRPNQWSQFINPEGDRRITVMAMYRLKDEYGVTFDWIYDGDRKCLPADLLEKIRVVERRGFVLPTTRRRGRKPKPVRVPK